MELEYRDMAVADLTQLCEIDRSEHITTSYATAEGELVPRAVDGHHPGWHEGTGGLSFDHQIEFCRGHMEMGARALGCFTADGRLVGFGLMTPDVEPGVAQLAFLQVSRGFRRAGIGAELLDRLTHWVLELGATEMYVSAAPAAPAVSFYRRAGFSPTDRPIAHLVALEPEDIQMRRPLQRPPGRVEGAPAKRTAI